MTSQSSLKLKKILSDLDNELGGDVVFFPTISIDKIKSFEGKISWELPEIYKYFYTKESNGLIIDDKRIYSFYSQDNKKTWVENLERMNDPKTSAWFKEKPQVFNDYVVIGSDSSVVFCLSKKYNLENPAIYICRNANNRKNVDLDNLNLDLAGLISEMVHQAF